MTVPSCYELVDIFILVIQKATNKIELEVRNIFLKENRFVQHLKNLYSIVFLEEFNKHILIDKVMEYKVKLILLFNVKFFKRIFVLFY